MSIFKINSLLYYLQFVVVAGVNVVCSPLMLGSLGDVLFGAWKIINRFLDLTTILDGRPGATLKIKLASALGRKESESYLRQLIGAASAVRWKALWIFIPVSLGFIFSAPYLISDLPEKNYLDIRAFSLVLIISFFFSTAYSIHDAALVSEMKSYLSSLIQIASSMVLGIGLLVVSVNSGSLFFVGLVTLLVSVLAFLMYGRVAAKFIKWYGCDRPDKNISMDFNRTNGWSIFWAVVEKLVLTIDLLLIGNYCGAAEAASYTFSSYSYQLALTIALVGTSAYVPAIMKNFSGGKILASRELIKVAKKKLLIVTAVSAIFIIFCNDYFVSVWAGSKIIKEDGISLILALMLMQLSYIRCQGQIMDALNLINVKSLYFFGGLIITFALVFLLDRYHKNISMSLILLCILVGRVPAMIMFSRAISDACNIIDGAQDRVK